MKRIFGGIDIEICPACGGALKVIACIEDPVVIKRILNHLKQKADANEPRQGSGELLCWDHDVLGFSLYLPTPGCVRIGEDKSYKIMGRTPLATEDTPLCQDSCRL